MHIQIRTCVWVGLSLAFSSVALALDHPPYLYKVVSATAVELTNTIGNGESKATDINNLGEIAGWAVAPNGAAHSFLYHPYGVMDDISGSVATLDSYAYGINDFSEIVGEFHHHGFNRPFHWHASTGFTEMSRDTPNPVDHSADARAINGHHDIVGTAHYELSVTVADLLPFRWENAFVNPTVPFAVAHWGYASATDISTSGWIVGNIDQLDFEKGYRFRDWVLSFVPNPAGAENEQQIFGVNESGAVTGRAGYSTGHLRAIFWDGHTTKSRFLGVLAGGDFSQGFEVNDQDFVAGFATKPFTTNTGDSVMWARAFIWHSDFGMYELPTLESRGGGPTQCWAKSLNNLKTTYAGLVIRVVGYCTHLGENRAVRWDVLIDEYRWFPD